MPAFLIGLAVYTLKLAIIKIITTITFLACGWHYGALFLLGRETDISIFFRLKIGFQRPSFSNTILKPLHPNDVHLTMFINFIILSNHMIVIKLYDSDSF